MKQENLPSLIVMIAIRSVLFTVSDKIGRIQIHHKLVMDKVWLTVGIYLFVNVGRSMAE
ncbi:hypothetical protein MNQ98_28645 [Paenibacillus sp. N3/727]|uniref:hypothetical protein n=1 Tax=Paenibacillus sp. N3/727 TaxID=2925845 RepID=UPI001F52CF80|nr:hypothetical protein [Paenibacillus sp. N3/727]UNK18326.1 hypothetical protein MNQ98_28645 [Paenibacillus sp. N3/727]